MKKADAIKTVIEELKAQNRSSLNADDFNRLQKLYSGKFTDNMALDLRAEAPKAGIEAFEDASLEDMLPKRRATAAEIAAGVEPGKQLRPNVTGSPKAKAGKVAVKSAVNITDDGVNLILKMMQETGLNVRGAITELTKRFEAFKKTNRDRAPELSRFINEAFPDGIESISRRLNEFRAYEQYLYDNGFLKNDDPPTGKDKKGLFTFEKLDRELNKLPKGGQNKRSNKGKQIFAIKERGGVPVIAGRDKAGKLVEDESRVRPHNLVISDKGTKRVKNLPFPVYLQTKLTRQIEMQDRQRKAAEKRERRKIDLPTPEEKPEPRQTLQSLAEPTQPMPQEEPKPKPKRQSTLMDIIKKGGRKGAIAFFPVVGAAMTVVDEALAAKPLNPYRTPEEQEYDRMMERAKKEELIPPESELRGRTMEEVKSRTSFMNQ